MKETFLSRFTPSLLTQQSLEAMFVQREPLARSIVEGIVESANTGNKHYYLVVGPRGIGKTHLVSLIYHRIATNEQLADKLLIAWLREEEWGVASYLDFLLVILRAMANETNDKQLQEQLANIIATGDAKLAKDQCEELLLKTIGKKTLLILTENLDQIFEGLGSDGQEQLRAFIQNNPIFTILATSQSLFADVTERNNTFYGFFDTQHLPALSLDEATSLVTNIAKQEGDEELFNALQTTKGRARMRVVHHLAGGSPRIYVVFSQFLTCKKLDELVEPLLKSLDELTPYYQSRMNELSPQQRKIVEYLCDQGGAIAVKQIASANFITHQTTSSQLGKLAELGFTRSIQRGRESLHELREPWLRLTLEVKKQRGGPISLIIEFLRLWYSIDELKQKLSNLPKDAETDRFYINHAINNIDLTDKFSIEKICETDIKTYLNENKKSEAIKAYQDLIVTRNNLGDKVNLAYLLGDTERFTEARDVLTDIIENNRLSEQQKTHYLYARGYAKGKTGDTKGEISDYSDAISNCKSPSKIISSVLYHRAIARTNEGAIESAIEDYTRIINMQNIDNNQIAQALVNRGYLLEEEGRTNDATNDFTTAINNKEISQEVRARAYIARGQSYLESNKPECSIDDFSQVIESDCINSTDKATAHYNRAIALWDLGNIQGAIEDFTQANNISDSLPDIKALSIYNRAVLKGHLDNYQDAENDYSYVINLSGVSNKYIADALINRSFCRLLLGHPEGSLDDYKTVIKMTAVSLIQKAQAWNGMCAIYLETGYMDKALDAVNQSIACDPNAALAHANKGELHYCMRQYSQALASLQHAQKISKRPKFGIESHIAATYIASGKKKLGAQQLNKSIHLLATKDDDEYSSNIAIIRTLLLRTRDQAEWKTMIKIFIDAFEVNLQIAQLGQGLVQSIRTMKIDSLTNADRKAWVDVWKELAGSYDSMKIPLQILEAAMIYLNDNDDRALLRLPIEQRRIAEPLVGADTGSLD